MPKKIIPLSDAKIKNTKPDKAKDITLGDGGGLFLRIRPNGTKQWLFNYSRPYTKKRNNIKFGNYPELPLLAARTKREDAKALLAQNIDPDEHRQIHDQQQAAANANTLKAIAGHWLEVKKASIEKNTAIDTWRSLELHIFPDLGNTPIHRITAKNAIKTLQPIAAKGNMETIKRLCGRMNEIMEYAVNAGLIQHNPLTGIRKAFRAAQKENLPTLKPEQLPELMRALSIASIKLTTRCLIEWQLHTMTRPGEAAGTRWKEIDLEKGVWLIPAERMKKRRAHAIPLSPQAVALLEVMKPISAHREYVFPADRNPREHANSQTANMALKRMGFEGLLVAHGLRALASTTLNEQGFDGDVIEAALAHIDQNEVRAAYNRADYFERRKTLMNWWSAHIEAAATGSTSLAANNIVQIKRIS